jgi:hypothetical protein
MKYPHQDRYYFDGWLSVYSLNLSALKGKETVDISGFFTGVLFYPGKSIPEMFYENL